MKMKYKKLYQVAIDHGTHRGTITTDQINFTIWISELAREFKIYKEVSPHGRLKILYIINYWGEKQEVGYIFTK